MFIIYFFVLLKLRIFLLIIKHTMSAKYKRNNKIATEVKKFKL